MFQLQEYSASGRAGTHLERYTGSNQAVMGKTLNSKSLADIEVPLPPLGDQIRIAHVLSKVEGLIAQRKQHLQQLDELLKSVFLEIFGDPVRNDRGWDKVSFSNILAEIESGKSPKCEARQTTEDEWGVLKLGSVTSCVYKQEENKALPPDVAPDTRWEVKQGDLLFSRKNTYELVAACAYVFETRSKLLLPDLIFRFVFKDDAEIHPLFIWKLLTSASQRKQVQSLAAGASGSMPNISKTNLKQTLLIKPPIELQNEFAGIVEKIEEIKTRYQTSLAELERLYGELSQRAFKGELDLSRIPVKTLSEETKTQIKEGTPYQASTPPLVTNEIDYICYPPEDINDLNSNEGRLSLVKKWLRASLSEGSIDGGFFSLSHFMETAKIQLEKLIEETANIDIDSGSNGFLRVAKNHAEHLLQSNTSLISLSEYEALKEYVFEQLEQEQLSQVYESISNQLRVKV